MGSLPQIQNNRITNCQRLIQIPLRIGYLQRFDDPTAIDSDFNGSDLRDARLSQLLFVKLSSTPWKSKDTIMCAFYRVGSIAFASFGNQVADCC